MPSSATGCASSSPPPGRADSSIARRGRERASCSVRPGAGLSLADRSVRPGAGLSLADRSVRPRDADRSPIARCGRGQAYRRLRRWIAVLRRPNGRLSGPLACPRRRNARRAAHSPAANHEARAAHSHAAHHDAQSPTPPAGGHEPRADRSVRPGDADRSVRPGAGLSAAQVLDCGAPQAKRTTQRSVGMLAQAKRPSSRPLACWRPRAASHEPRATSATRHGRPTAGNHRETHATHEAAGRW